MPDITKTMKLRILVEKEQIPILEAVMDRYREACNCVSAWCFEHETYLSYPELHKNLYNDLRETYGLKAQMAQSCMKTVVARYKAVETQLSRHPYKYKGEAEEWYLIPKTLDWLMKPVLFARPQADFVRGRDYSFVTDKKTGEPMISLNTLDKRIRVKYVVPECFKEYFSPEWSFGTGKIVTLKGKWYFHIPVTKKDISAFDTERVRHVVGIDRGLRFLAVTYDEKGRTSFYDGRDILAKRDSFQQVRSELQSKGTKSAKRALKRISGRENRWMSDVNHQISKTLVNQYGEGTLFVMEDLTGISFSEEPLSHRTRDGRRELRSWTFYQLEEFLSYKAEAMGSKVLKVSPKYTSQRCPKCGRIHKGNRHHKIHTYICDCCGYQSNDDRIGAMNIQTLGTFYVSGMPAPRFTKKKH